MIAASSRAYKLVLVNPRPVLRLCVYGVRCTAANNEPRTTTTATATTTTTVTTTTTSVPTAGGNIARPHKLLSTARSQVLTKVNMSLTRTYGRIIVEEAEERFNMLVTIRVIPSIFHRTPQWNDHFVASTLSLFTLPICM
ncbi:hypothetical protein HN011_005945 [Eciton burchellii]|nr:hypothetical protein HN011_005945 [Eciton burchellii]